MEALHPVRWLRAHPVAADVLFAALITALSLTFHLTEHGDGIREPDVWGVLLTVLATAPIAARRTWPIPVLLVVIVAQAVAEGFNYVGSGWSGVLVAVYTVGSLQGGAAFRRLGTVLLPALIAFVTWGVVRGDAPWQAIISAPVMFLGALVFGDNVRRRRLHVAELTERAARLERERELVAHQHIQDERTRIARELHDVVAHRVSLMVIQAAAARRQMAVDPRQAEAAIANVEDAGRTAMQEMRRILGVLREDTAGGGRAPQPSLEHLGELVQSAPDLPVALRTDGDLAGLPTGVEVSAYRIVQEALTNVRRHAGPVQRVDVHVQRCGDLLTVEVADDGRGASVSPNGAGFGILGMRERVAAYDGEVLAGPRPGGGWRVRAVFPVRTA